LREWIKVALTESIYLLVLLTLFFDLIKHIEPSTGILKDRRRADKIQKKNHQLMLIMFTRKSFNINATGFTFLE